MSRRSAVVIARAKSSVDHLAWRLLTATVLFMAASSSSVHAQSWRLISPQPVAGRVTSIGVEQTFLTDNPNAKYRVVVTTDPDGVWFTEDVRTIPLHYAYFSFLAAQIHTPMGVIGPSQDGGVTPGRAYVLDEFENIGYSPEASMPADPSGYFWKGDTHPAAPLGTAIAVDPSDPSHVIEGASLGSIADSYNDGARSTWCLPTGGICNSIVANPTAQISDIEFARENPNYVWISSSPCYHGYQQGTRQCYTSGGNLIHSWGIGFSSNRGDSPPSPWTAPIAVNPGGGALPERQDVNRIFVINKDTVLTATDDGIHRCNNCTLPSRTWDDLTFSLPIRRVSDVHYARDAGGNQWIFVGLSGPADMDPTDVGDGGVFRAPYDPTPNPPPFSWVEISCPMGTGCSTFPRDHVSSLGGHRDDPTILYVGYENNVTEPSSAHPNRQAVYYTTSATGAATAIPIPGPVGAGGISSVSMAHDRDDRIVYQTTCQQGLSTYEPGTGPSPTNYTRVVPPRNPSGALFLNTFHYGMRLAQDPFRDIVWATSEAGLFKSIDEGATWEDDFSPPFPQFLHKHGVGIAPGNPDVV